MPPNQQSILDQLCKEYWSHFDANLKLNRIEEAYQDFLLKLSKQGINYYQYIRYCQFGQQAQ